MSSSNEVILGTNYGILTNKYCGELDVETRTKICSTLALLVHVANADRKLASQEISYLKRYLKKTFELFPDQYRNLVQGFNSIYKKKNTDSLLHTNCKKYLKATFNEHEKEKYLETLMLLSCADREMSKIEISFIRNISISIDLDRKDVTEKLITRSLELIRSVDAEILQDLSLHTQADELEEISITGG